MKYFIFNLNKNPVISTGSASEGFDARNHLEKTEASRDSWICEAVGCLKHANITIELKAGHHRTIQLSFCEDCVTKFIGDD